MASETGRGATNGEGEGDRVNFDYIKGSLFRTVRPDGAIGTITPSGLLQIAFYSERQAIPQRIVYGLKEDGTLGEEVDRVGRDAVVREVEVAVSLDPGTARAVMAFLTDLLAQTDTEKREDEIQ